MGYIKGKEKFVEGWKEGTFFPSERRLGFANTF
jgi:hypothetical protein